MSFKSKCDWNLNPNDLIVQSLEFVLLKLIMWLWGVLFARSRVRFNFSSPLFFKISFVIIIREITNLLNTKLKRTKFFAGYLVLLWSIDPLTLSVQQCFIHYYDYRDLNLIEYNYKIKG